VIILAAGIGARLTSEHNEIPKCLISYKNQKNIQRIVNFFTKYNIQNNDIVTVIGKEGKCWTTENKRTIRKIVPNTIINKNNLITNNAYSLQLVLEKIEKDDLIILDGDLFLLDSIIIEKFILSKQNCILGKVAINNYNNKNLIRKNENNEVIDFGKNILIDDQAIIYGPMIKLIKNDYDSFSKVLFQKIFYNKNIDRVLDIFTKIALMKVIVSDDWLNINQPSDLTKLN
jgi:choline kinase